MGYQPSVNSMYYAAEFGELTFIVDLICRFDVPVTEGAAITACSAGRLEVLTVFARASLQLTEGMLTAAILGEHFRVVAWLLRQGLKVVTEAPVYLATRIQNRHILDLLLKRGYPWGTDASEECLQRAWLPGLQLLARSKPQDATLEYWLHVAAGLRLPTSIDMEMWLRRAIIADSVFVN